MFCLQPCWLVDSIGIPRAKRSAARGATEQKLLVLAEDVRTARIGVLRMKRAKLVPCGGEELQTKYAKIDRQIDELRTMSPETILVEFLGQES